MNDTHLDDQKLYVKIYFLPSTVWKIIDYTTSLLTVPYLMSTPLKPSLLS